MSYDAKTAMQEWCSHEDLSWLDFHEVKISRNHISKAVFNLKAGDLAAELAIWGDKGTYSFTAVDLGTDSDVLSQNGEAETINEINQALSQAIIEIRKLARRQA